jgi:hypothetical protein
VSLRRASRGLWTLVALSLQACNCGGGATPDAGADAGFDAGFDAGPQPLPGSLEVAVAAANGDLLLLRLDGGFSTLVPASTADERRYTWPRWQPGSGRLAFVDGDQGFVREPGGAIAVAAPSGGSFAGRAQRVEWSPDGTRLAIGGRTVGSNVTGVFLVAPDGGFPERLFGENGWSWAGSGALAYLTSDGEGGYTSWRYDVDAGSSTRLVDAQLLDGAGDGRVLYVDQRRLGDGGVEATLRAALPDGGDAPLFSTGATLPGLFVEAALFSPYAPEVAVLAFDQRDGAFLLRVSPAGVQTVFEGSTSSVPVPLCARFVPGGEFLAYLQNAPTPTLFLAARDGGVTRLASPELFPGLDQGCMDWRGVP